MSLEKYTQQISQENMYARYTQSSLILWCLLLGGITTAQTRYPERGLAEMIENSANQEHHLALHRSAPVGTRLLVKNSANGRTAIVKVVGKLPDTGANEKLIIKVTKITYNALLASGKRFGVEIYLAPKDNKIVYKVKSGDTLYDIAQRHKVSIDQLKEWNSSLGETPLMIGQEIVIIQKR